MWLISVVVASGGLVITAPALARLGSRVAGWTLAVALLALAAVLVQSYPGDGRIETHLAWMPTIGVDFGLRLDGLSFFFALIVLIIGAIVMIYASGYITEPQPLSFYTLMTAFAAAMLLLVLADDLIVMFVAWELTTLCSYLLILRSGPQAGPPATRTLLVTAAGGLCLLGAVALIAVETGTTNLTTALEHPAWASDPIFTGTAAVLIAVAAMTKSAQFPFHSWLPDAMVAPAPVSAYLHAAAMVKAGIFLLMLFANAASNSPIWHVMLISVGLTTAVMGAVFALQRTDLKELLAYSTVSQLGLIVAVIGVGTPGAMLAASIHIAAHALFKSAAFMSVGLLERRTGTRDIRELAGLARALPWDAAMLTLAVVSMAGIPPLLGFVSKELIFDSFLAAPAGAGWGWLLALIAACGAVLTVAYSARMLVTTLPGDPIELRPRAGTEPMTVAVSLSAAGGVIAGLVVWLLDDLVGPAAAIAAGTNTDDIYGLSLWHGVNAPLALSAVAIVSGLWLTVRRTRVDQLLDRPLFPGTGVQVVQSLHDRTISSGRRVGDLTRTDAPAAHLAVPIVLLGIASGGVTLLWTGAPQTMRPEPVDLGLLVVISLGLVAVISATARLTALIATGVVGFSIALWYFNLGASDVALTQLLVEILTVVIMVLVLRRMSVTFSPIGRSRTVVAALAALAAGVTATVATLIFTGHRSLSPAGEYFLAEAENDTGGTNIVNTILVDFRAFDTLGELVVLAICGVAVSALLNARNLVNGPANSFGSTVISDPVSNAVFLSVIGRVLVPAMLIGSVFALWRGHNDPGGGFIAALIGASALALSYLSAASDTTSRLNWPYLSIAGSGIIVAVASGLLGLAEGSFLRPLHADLFGLHLTTALIFDVGVYLAVFGVILAALNLLGTSQPGTDLSGDKQEIAPTNQEVRR